MQVNCNLVWRLFFARIFIAVIHVIVKINKYCLLTILCDIQYNGIMMNNKQNLELEKLKQEMRRGTIVLATMSQLTREQYGYSLIKSLNEQGFEIGQDTLYPLLRRLEEQQLLDSEWRVEDPRPRRYYRLNDNGKEVLRQLSEDWRLQTEVIRRLLNEAE